jgi:tRNA A-37 threonylcarbamoyl transferase component Bud32
LLTVRLLREEAKQLRAAIGAGALREHGVVDCAIMGPAFLEQTAGLPKGQWAAEATEKAERSHALGGLGVEVTSLRGIPPRYEKRELVGRGRTSVVYRAYDTELDRIIALKLIESDDPRDRGRFLHAAMKVASLHHPYILSIYDVGEYNGRPYIVMEWAGGGSLAHLLAHFGRSPEQAASLVARVARGVQVLHQHGILHGDLKPGNILFNDRGEPMVTGWDEPLVDISARLMGAYPKSGHALPLYRAPEQAQLHGENIDARSDVYALGAILYECLTGRPPFIGATHAEIVSRSQLEDPVPPRQLRPNVLPDLEAICLKCLNMDPARRYPTAEAVADELERFLRGLPTQARRGDWLLWPAAWVRRHPIVLAAYAASLVIAFAVGNTVATRDSSLQAVKFRAEAQRLAAVLQMREGAKLCERGEAARGLPVLAQGLEQCPDSAPDLQRALRTALASTAARLHALDAAFPAPAPTTVAAITPDGKTALLGGKGAFLLDLESRETWPLPARPEGDEVTAAAFSPDGKLLATSTMRPGKDRTGESVIRLTEPATREAVGADIVHPGAVRSVAFRPSGKALLVGARSGTSLQCYDVSTRQPVSPTWECHDIVYAVAYSPDGRFVATAAQENTARLWDADTGKAAGPPMPHPEAVFTVAFSPDGKTLVTGCRDGATRFWDAATGKRIGPVLRHRGPVRSAVFSSDGRLVLTSSEDGTARLWEAETGEPIGQAMAHPDELRQALFTPDQKRVLTAGLDGMARLWRVADDRASVAEMRCPGAVSVIAFSPDGRQVLTGCEDSADEPGQSRLWDARTGEPLGMPMPHRTAARARCCAGRSAPTGTWR